MQLREKQGLLKTLIGLAARLPWWLGLALALVSYVALHMLAQKPVPAAMQPGQMGSFLLANLTQLLARAGQYALPFFFGVSALVSAFRRAKAERLYAAAARRPDAIGQMSWQDFEILVGEYFRRQGFSVTDNGGVGGSGMGHYHGKEGFETFSKLRPVFYQARFSSLKFLMPPYGRFADFMLRFLTK